MNLTSLLKEFFVENEFNTVSEKVAVVRNDGTVVYSNSIDSMEASNIGALASGIWQAAQSLSSLVNSSIVKESYRMAFDTSSDGIYLLPVNLGGRDCYLCCIFKDQINPGKLKQNMRNIAFLLEAFAREESFQAENQDTVGEESGFLFTDITDEEMDKLFGVAGI